MVPEVVTLLVLSKGQIHHFRGLDLGSFRFCSSHRWEGKVIYTTNSTPSMNNELRKATRNRVQFAGDESAIKTLWLMICNIEDKRAAKRAKQGKRVASTSGRLIEGRKVTNWKQAINQMAVAFPDRFEAYL